MTIGYRREMAKFRKNLQWGDDEPLSMEEIDAIYREVWSEVPHSKRPVEFAQCCATLAVAKRLERLKD